jgi:hypothetical protein
MVGARRLRHRAPHDERPRLFRARHGAGEWAERNRHAGFDKVSPKGVVRKESSGLSQWRQELFFQLAPLSSRSYDIALFHMPKTFDLLRNAGDF